MTHTICPNALALCSTLHIAQTQDEMYYEATVIKEFGADNVVYCKSGQRPIRKSSFSIEVRAYAVERRDSVVQRFSVNAGQDAPPTMGIDSAYAPIRPMNQATTVRYKNQTKAKNELPLLCFQPTRPRMDINLDGYINPTGILHQVCDLCQDLLLLGFWRFKHQLVMDL